VLRFPLSADRMAVLVGAPGEASPSVDDLSVLLSALAPALAGRAVLMPYGTGKSDRPLGQEVADRIGREVLAAHVLPRETPSGQTEFSALGSDGQPTWRPYVAISRYQRGKRPAPWWWTAPIPELRFAPDAVCALTEGWVLELIPSGMLVRPGAAPSPAEYYHHPVDPEMIGVIFTDFPGSSAQLPEAVLRAMHTLLSRLPAADRRRLRLGSAAAPHLMAQVDRLAELLLGSGGEAPSRDLVVPTNEGPLPEAPAVEVSRATAPADIAAPTAVAPVETLVPAAVVPTETPAPAEAPATTVPAVSAPADELPEVPAPDAEILAPANETRTAAVKTAAPAAQTTVRPTKPAVPTVEAIPAAKARPAAKPIPAAPANKAVPAGTVLPTAPARGKDVRTVHLPPEPQAAPPEAVRERANVVFAADGRIWPPATTPRPIRALEEDDEDADEEPAPDRTSLKQTGLSQSVPQVPDVPRTPVPDITGVLGNATANAGAAGPGNAAQPGPEPTPAEPPHSDGPSPAHPAEQLPPVLLGSPNGSGPAPSSDQESPVPSPTPENPELPATPAGAPGPPDLLAPDRPAQAQPPVSDEAPATAPVDPPNVPAAQDPAPLAAPPTVPDTPVPPAAPPAAQEPPVSAATPAAVQDAPIPPTDSAPASAAESGPKPLRPLRIGPNTTRPAERGSTPDERQEFRTAHGWRYDAAAQFVSKLLSARPGLRGENGDDAVIAELAAAHLFALSDPAELAVAMRANTVPPDQHAFLSCAVSGLRRLPSFTGPVLRPVPAGLDIAALYRKLDELVEPGSLPAHSDLTRRMSGEGELLVWSSTARHLDGLAGEEPTDLVSFQPSTVFRVLDIDTSAAVTRVLLAETPPSWIGKPNERRDERILSRLRAAAAARAELEDDSEPAPFGKIAPDLVLGMMPEGVSR
jgi:hypothetical protein